MSLFLSDSRSSFDENSPVQANTYSPRLGKKLSGKVHVGNLEIDNSDFCELVLYFLTNTDLDPEHDSRESLLKTLKELNITEHGYNQGYRRIIWNPTNDPNAGKWVDNENQ